MIWLGVQEIKPEINLSLWKESEVVQAEAITVHHCVREMVRI